MTSDQEVPVGIVPDDPDELELANEEALIGALLLRPASVDLLPSLREEDLARPLHRVLLVAVRSAVRRSEDPAKVDMLVVFDQLRRFHDEGMGRDAAGPVPKLSVSFLDAPRMFDLAARCPNPGNLGWYAARVREASRRRAIDAAGTRLRQISRGATLSVSEEQVLEVATAVWLELGQVIDPTSDAGSIVGLSSWEEFVDDPAVHQFDWAIPLVMEVMDRVVWVAAEGVGKSVLARQVALMLACGRHPFFPWLAVPPQRSLIVDLENPPSLVRRQGAYVVNLLREKGWWQDGMAHVWRNPKGLNIRKGDDLRLLDRVIGDRSPRFVAIGPLRKLARTAGKGETYESQAEETQAALDYLRTRHRFALWLEHHAPKAQGGHERELDPIGSGAWISWPEFGRSLRKEREGGKVTGQPTGRLKVGEFRQDREEGRLWPLVLRRGKPGEFPWVADWTTDQLAELDLPEGFLA